MSCVHTLVTCQFAGMCWNHAGIVVNDRDCTNLSQWLYLVMEVYESKDVQIACIYARKCGKIEMLRCGTKKEKTLIGL